MGKIEERATKQISNRRLIFILALLIVISVAGTLISLYKIRVAGIPKITGMALYGTANVTILAGISINITSNVDFGSGTPYAGATTELTTESNNTLGFSNCSLGSAGLPEGQSQDCRGLEIENIGNIYINITITASQSAEEFFDGPDAEDEFLYATLSENRSKQKTGGCNNNTNMDGTQNSGNWSIYPAHSNSTFINWTPITKTPTTSPVCFNLSFDTTKNVVTVEFNLTIPQGESTGTKINTFTFSAAQI